MSLLITMNLLLASEEKIRRAILQGSMEGKCLWFPADLIMLRKKLSYLDSGIRADSFYHSRIAKIKQRKKLAVEISRFDPRESNGFYTEINLFIEHSTSIWNTTIRVLREEVNLHFFIQFDKEVKIICKEVDTDLAVMKPRHRAGFQKRAIKRSFTFEGADVPSQYLMLPSFILNNLVDHKKKVLRYRYREDDE